ncbi:MAG: hypothetical protein AN483_15920 [Aphanizomenon flos-aquae MDT14a]|uniref:Uncharacterized protein n=1 Tax=Aphanizomenon flos-aquae LD13 TaxID=1710894 RepID=A0A1B7VMB0_APHFL|nr:MAG: hypothetical protein AN481_16660 [Aphanizomenon flos-aquae LD13]OBQ28372.1 MAG: hypothetical protein AN483_15920 [Aphanizomenon flos-aquae MDT14a]
MFGFGFFLADPFSLRVVRDFSFTPKEDIKSFSRIFKIYSQYQQLILICIEVHNLATKLAKLKYIAEGEARDNK